MKRSRTGLILHLPRDVSTRRPMHITFRIAGGIDSIRTDEVRDEIRRLFAGARGRGVRTVAAATMPNHGHWIVMVDSREALHDATRYVFGGLAKFINRRDGRRGKVLVERYWSEASRNVRQAFQTIGYVLKNPVTAGFLPLRRGGLDPYLVLDRAVMLADRFLRSVLGPTEAVQRDLLGRMAAGPVIFAPLSERLQARLPGL